MYDFPLSLAVKHRVLRQFIKKTTRHVYLRIAVTVKPSFMSLQGAIVGSTAVVGVVTINIDTSPHTRFDVYLVST